MFSKGMLSLALVLLVSAALTGPCFAGSVFFDFHYDFSIPLYSDMVWASGTLEVTDYGDGSTCLSTGDCSVIGIAGKRHFIGSDGILVDQDIVGLIPAGDFAGNSNMLHSFGSLLDFDGLAFSVLNGDAPGPVNVYFDGFAYREYWMDPAGGISDEAYGSFQVSPPADPAVPEPSTAWLLIAGSAGLAGWGRRRRRN